MFTRIARNHHHLFAARRHLHDAIHAAAAPRLPAVVTDGYEIGARLLAHQDKSQWILYVLNNQDKINNIRELSHLFLLFSETSYLMDFAMLMKPHIKSGHELKVLLDVMPDSLKMAYALENMHVIKIDAERLHVKQSLPKIFQQDFNLRCMQSMSKNLGSRLFGQSAKQALAYRDGAMFGLKNECLRLTTRKD